MKTKLLTALVSSIFLAVLACPVLAAPIDAFVAGYGLDTSAIPATFDAGTVLGWWLSGGFAAYPLGVLFVFLLALCTCVLIAYSSALKSRAEDGGVLGDARVKTGREVVKGSMTWDGSTIPSSRGFVYGFTKYRGKPCYLYEPKKMIFVSGATGSGKSRYCYLPSIDLLSYGDASNGSEPATIVVSDVKNELIELTGDELARRGYRVLLLDTQHPYRGQMFNPLKQVLDLHAEGRDQEAEQAADAIAELVVQDDEKGKGSHWTASARGLLSALVLLVSMSDECPVGSKHLATVCEVLDRGTEACWRQCKFHHFHQRIFTNRANADAPDSPTRMRRFRRLGALLLPVLTANRHVLQAVRPARYLDHRAVVAQPVGDRRGRDVAAEHVAPPADRHVGRDDRRPLERVAPVHQLEQQVGALLPDIEVAQLVYYQQAAVLVEPHPARQRLLRRGML